MPVLITTKEAIELTGIPASKFAAVMRQNDVVPVDFGRGRGNGLRWVREDVMRALVCGLLGRTPKGDDHGCS